MEEFERLLEEISKHRERFHFSLDIYYDVLGVDRGEQFVCKISNAPFSDCHFRNNKALDSMLEALSKIKNHGHA